MAPAPAESFQQIIELFQAHLQKVIVARREIRGQVALLELEGKYGPYRVHLREVRVISEGRKYAYYVLRDEDIIVGFDNAPDPEALKLKYGSDYVEHRLERIPHRHTAHKAEVFLTDEITADNFMQWILTNLKRE